MSVRLRGVVRIARLVQERLRHGVPPEERASFLAGVREQIVAIEDLCEQGGGTTADLPPRSRRAYALLREIAARAPEDLPAPAPDGPPAPPRVGVRNVVSTMDRCLARLAARPQDAAARAEVAGHARACVEAVRALCQEAGTTPAALPGRTGPAFGMLSWFLAEGNLDLYCEQVTAARRVLAGVPLGDGRPPPDVRVRFQPGQRLFLARRRGPLFEWRLHVGYLAADDARFASLPGRAGLAPADPHALRELLAFEASEGFLSVCEEFRAHWPGEEDAEGPAGRTYDLRALFEDLNRRFFGGALRRPRLVWRSSLAASRFGLYVPTRDLVVIDTRLDDPAVPEFVAECVLYHEMLHVHHGVEHAGRRRLSHTPAFRADERRHPRLDETEAWLRRLAASAVTAPAGPPPPPS